MATLTQVALNAVSAVATEVVKPAAEEDYPGKQWPELTHTQLAVLVGIPVGSLIAIFIIFTWIWKVPEPSLPVSKPSTKNYGTAAAGNETGPKDGETEEEFIMRLSRRSTDTLQPGQVAGAYDEDWKTTFDYVFLVGWLIALVLLLIITFFAEPALFRDGTFWLMQLPKFGAMVVVSLLGGLVCRHFCTVDEKGYIITTVSSGFKVNYTRKLQHFAAYMIPLVIKTSGHKGPLELAWGDMFTLLAFLVLIKPVRESSTFFMLQFNSLDRPEDRPNTLKWIIAGNILPGLVLTLFFRFLFDSTGQGALVFIIIYITGIGDGFAEPVGIIWGRHKYKVAGWFSPRKYTRSWEGSMCVFMSGIVFPALQYASFANFTQVVTAMIILAPTMAYAEATAPHTMDTPMLMGLSGLILYVIIQVL